MPIRSMFVPLLLLTSSALKLLFTFAYRSTDFEVHRNWLAITYSLSPSKWYFESTSQWTLDYPPLFAWFEWILSQIAVQIDPEMCVIRKVAYDSSKAIWFQRGSVLFCEISLYYALWKTCMVLGRNGSIIMKRRFIPTLTLLAFNYGLIIVDHIHFQYNGVLFGVLLFSGALLLDGCFLKAAACFTVLINLKHLFLYIAPLYFVYILFNYCLAREKRSFLTFFARLFKVGIVVAVVTLISFSFFLSEKQLRQIYTRLFPFDRGLTHAYWAPNVWALYNGAERGLLVLNSHVDIRPQLSNKSVSMTRGLVSPVEHVMLPSIQPFHTAILVILSMLPPLVRCAVKSSAFSELKAADHYQEYLIALTGTAWASFLFGWHVHEKAILVILLPLNLLAMAVPKFRTITFYATTLGHFSLMPLIPTKAETPAVLFLFCSYTMIHWLILFRLHPASRDAAQYRTNTLVECLARMHLWGLVPLYAIAFILWPLFPMKNRLPFLPLMATSMYVAIGLCFAYIYFIQLSWRSEEKLISSTVEGKKHVLETEEAQRENVSSRKNKKKKAKKLKTQ